MFLHYKSVASVSVFMRLFVTANHSRTERKSLFTPHSFCCRCALNTGQISWSINVVTVALWLCFSASGRHIFATPVMMISRG